MFICEYCRKSFGKNNIERHRKACKQNPVNRINCINCGKSVWKGYPGEPVLTCSYACSNTYFRSGENNGRYKEPEKRKYGYIEVCKKHHSRECCVCGEKIALDVHHMDRNHQNMMPNNLIFLCRTHHMYWHSRHQHLIYDKVMNYLSQWEKNNASQGL